MNKTWPTLYKVTSTGKIQQWTISVGDNIITTRWGQQGGAIQEAHDEIKEGKNIGRANETTAIEQAAAEAQSQWEKKLKKDYVESVRAAESGESSSLVEGGILPMLAHRYDKYADKITFPAYAQPKLDGHRCIALIDDNGKCTLWSRTRKPITSMPHITAELGHLGLSNTILDGELYNHDYKDNFEAITSLIRPVEPKPDHAKVQYHIYDVANTGGPFSERFARYRAILGNGSGPLMPVETIQVANEDELMAAFETFRSQGYEGAIVRNLSGLYVNKRSYDLQKVKEFDDAEFEVIGVTEGRGKLAGHAIFVCKTKAGVEFEAKMIGKLENLKKYYEDPSLAIGKMLTVQYQGFTTKSNVPRFPVAQRFREDV